MNIAVLLRACMCASVCACVRISYMFRCLQLYVIENLPEWDLMQKHMRASSRKLWGRAPGLVGAEARAVVKDWGSFRFFALPSSGW